MPGPSLALDTSVIIPALLPWHEHHALAYPVVRDGLAAENGLVVPLPALIEGYAVMTRLPHPWRIAPADAHRMLCDTFRDRARIVALDGLEGWTLLDTAIENGAAGGASYDFHIAACAAKAQAAQLATFNARHFARFALDLELLVPA